MISGRRATYWKIFSAKFRQWASHNTGKSVSGDTKFNILQCLWNIPSNMQCAIGFNLKLLECTDVVLADETLSSNVKEKTSKQQQKTFYKIRNIKLFLLLCYLLSVHVMATVMCWPTCTQLSRNKNQRQKIVFSAFLPRLYPSKQNCTSWYCNLSYWLNHEPV